MSDRHPYANVNSGLIQLLDQLRKSFPALVDADLVKKLGIAPKNESYLINVIRFLGLIDDEGKRTEKASKIFTMHEDSVFQPAFAGAVKEAYSALFGLYKEEAWTQTETKLISFFRQSDKSSEIVGGRQASTFKALAIYAGRSNETSSIPKPKGSTPKASKNRSKQSPRTDDHTLADANRKRAERDPRVALTVRIEVNLPAGGDQDTYDKIFKSIRENLMNG